MVTLISKVKATKVYNLECAIPLVGAKPVKQDNGVEKLPTERVITLAPFEKRHGLPPAVLESAEIKKAIASKWLVAKTEVVNQQQPEAKPIAASKPSKKKWEE